MLTAPDIWCPKLYLNSLQLAAGQGYLEEFLTICDAPKDENGDQLNKSNNLKFVRS